MVNLIIGYSKESEVARIKFTLSKLDWYREQGIGVNLPEGVTEDNIQKAVDKDYKEENYKPAAAELLADFNKIPKEFFVNLEKRSGKKLPDDLEVYLTRYGCGGSYKVPNRVIINIVACKKGHKPIYGLKHELIHIMVEDEVQKKHLSQEEKEDLVNGIYAELDK